MLIKLGVIACYTFLFFDLTKLIQTQIQVVCNQRFYLSFVTCPFL